MVHLFGYKCNIRIKGQESIKDQNALTRSLITLLILMQVKEQNSVLTHSSENDYDADNKSIDYSLSSERVEWCTQDIVIVSSNTEVHSCKCSV